jgi:hypothetical protein
MAQLVQFFWNADEMQSCLNTLQPNFKEVAAMDAVQYSMDFIFKFLVAATCCLLVVAIVCGRQKVNQLMEMLQHIQRAAQISADKLAHCEKRLEKLQQTGAETSRHPAQLVSQYDMDRAHGALQWPRRRTLEIYGDWRFARQMMQASYSCRMWELVVESAVRWIRADIADTMHYDEREGNRLQGNLEYFRDHINDNWRGSPTCEHPMREFHRLENLQFARKNILETIAFEQGHGVSFLSRYL